MSIQGRFDKFERQASRLLLARLAVDGTSEEVNAFMQTLADRCGIERRDDVIKESLVLGVSSKAQAVRAERRYGTAFGVAISKIKHFTGRLSTDKLDYLYRLIDRYSIIPSMERKIEEAKANERSDP